MAASINREEKRLQELFFKRRRFNIWRNEFLNKQKANAQEASADSHYFNHLIVKYFNYLFTNLANEQKRRAIFDILKKKKALVMIKSSYKKWRKAFTEGVKATKRKALYALQTEREALDKWIMFLRIQKEEKLRISKAVSFYDKNWERRISSIFVSWVRLNQRKKHGKTIVENWKQRKNRKISKKVFWEFQLNKLRNKKEKYENSLKNYEVNKVKNINKNQLNIQRKLQIEILKN